MAAITPGELLRLWTNEQIEPEHAIGQLVQQIARLQDTVDVQRRALAQMQRELAALRDAPPAPEGRAAAKCR
jgi:hypothetical protein